MSSAQRIEPALLHRCPTPCLLAARRFDHHARLRPLTENRPISTARLRCVGGSSPLLCSCGTVNPDGAKFCAECGELLRLSCPTCRAEVVPDAEFCPECGPARIDGVEPAHVHAESPRGADPPFAGCNRGRTQTGDGAVLRRQGVDALSRPLDPEEWRRIMSGFLDVLCEGVLPLRGHGQQVHG